ncbi:MAG: DUF4926 domain-containing protein [Dyadobacter sp.]|uniref:DUF4926 domain-containing protein n=1 Tax=Dyadobacter sp. TaxID=1914288 RepID=UPI003263030F
MTINEFDKVVLAENIAELGLETGDVGTVVMTHHNGKGFEVEFITLDGETVAVETLLRHQVRPIRKGEIAHVREIHSIIGYIIFSPSEFFKRSINISHWL